MIMYVKRKIEEEERKREGGGEAIVKREQRTRKGREKNTFTEDREKKLSH